MGGNGKGKTEVKGEDRSKCMVITKTLIGSRKTAWEVA